MSVDRRSAVTRTDLRAFPNLVEDTCSDPNCGMTILVEQDHKQQGRKSRCMSCIMRAKMVKGEVR